MTTELQLWKQQGCHCEESLHWATSAEQHPLPMDPAQLSAPLCPGQTKKAKIASVATQLKALTLAQRAHHRGSGLLRA